jgi:hypothetical protein
MSIIPQNSGNGETTPPKSSTEKCVVYNALLIDLRPKRAGAFMEARVFFFGGSKISSDAKSKAICHRQQKPLDRRDNFGCQRPEFENHQSTHKLPGSRATNLHPIYAFATLSNVFWTCVSEEMVSTRSLSAAVKTDNSDKTRKKTHAKCHSLNKKYTEVPKTT